MSDTPLRLLFASFSTTFDGSALTRGAAAVDGLLGKLGKLGAALAGSAIVAGVVSFTRGVIHQGDELITTAERLGLATQALQQWQYVANLADVDAGELSAGFRILQRNIIGATEGGEEQTKAFQKLGLSMADLKGADLDAVLTKAADGFAKLENPIQRTALAQQIFGRGGAALVPLLSKGSAGVQELKDEFIALGGGLNNETLAAANAADDAFKRLRLGMRSLTANAVTPFINGAIRVATWLKDVIVRFKQWERGTAIVKAAIIALTIAAVAAAAPILVAFAPLILTTLAWVAGLTAAVLILDDLINLFTGGESALGSWIDESFGLGTTEKFVQDLKAAWDAMSPALETAWSFFKSLMPTVREVTDSMKALGDDIAFVVDQFKHLDEAFEGLKKFGHDVLVKLGLADMTKDEQKFAHGAEGFGSDQTRTDAQGNRLVPIGQPGETLSDDARGGFGFFRDFSNFANDRATNINRAPAIAGGAVNLPEVKISPSAPGRPNVAQTVNVTVAPEAKPDPKLVPMVRRAVTEALDQQAREISAGT
jgi:hypothetical protein